MIDQISDRKLAVRRDMIVRSRAAHLWMPERMVVDHAAGLAGRPAPASPPLGSNEDEEPRLVLEHDVGAVARRHARLKSDNISAYRGRRRSASTSSETLPEKRAVLGPGGSP